MPTIRPIGVPIEAQSPAEIAVAVLAEVIGALRTRQLAIALVAGTVSVVIAPIELVLSYQRRTERLAEFRARARQELGAAGAPALAHKDIVTIMTGLMVAMFPAALDSTITGPAMPTLARELGGQAEQMAFVALLVGAAWYGRRKLAALRRAESRHRSSKGVALERLDLHDIGTEVAEQHGRVGAGEHPREVGDDDASVTFYQDDAIDLGEMLREQFYLAVPMKPLCRDDCKGLCPQCGTNRNTGQCSCTQGWVDPRLAALQALKTRES